MVDNPVFADEKPDYLFISHEVLPALEESGVGRDAITQMMEINPRAFFSRAWLD
jgi:predicted metal-dependent phosphotriesterase family hydrolase